MTVWIVAGILIAAALLYGIFGTNQMVLFWTIVLAMIVLSIVSALMYCLNKQAEKGKQS
jgi:hypothetical protein